MAEVQSIDILLVEDNSSDAKLIQRWFRDSPIVRQIHVVTDGQQALDFLRRSGDFRQATRPDLMLLDLHLPRLSGFDVLAEVKSHPDLASIPIIVLTDSAVAQDAQRAYRLQADYYVPKPSDADEFCELVRAVENFWRRHTTDSPP